MKEQTNKIINKNFKKVEKKIENHASELERNNKIAMYSDNLQQENHAGSF